MGGGGRIQIEEVVFHQGQRIVSVGKIKWGSCSGRRGVEDNPAYALEINLGPSVGLTGAEHKVSRPLIPLAPAPTIGNARRDIQGSAEESASGSKELAMASFLVP